MGQRTQVPNSAREFQKEWRMRILTRSLAAAAVVVAAGHLTAFPAHAQAPSTSPSPSPSANVSDQKIDAAANAMKRVASLKADYQQRIKTAPDADRDRIAAEAQDALMKAVTDQGLSVEEYSSILTVAQNNSDLRDKLLERLHAKESGSTKDKE
jgi:predicted ATPase with chaperone activity